jgi:hypothetical protein
LAVHRALLISHVLVAILATNNEPLMKQTPGGASLMEKFSGSLEVASRNGL